MGKKIASLVSYDDRIHREQLFELNVEYFEYLRDAAMKNMVRAIPPYSPSLH